MERTERPHHGLLFLPHQNRRLPIPKPPSSLLVISDESAEYSEDSSTDCDPCVSERRPHFITEEDLNDLVHDLTKTKGRKYEGFFSTMSFQKCRRELNRLHGTVSKK
ncbi:unnamed protein product [Clavelina lepadiformis]|uniref:Uncharacterized protein n=1 Tax=Clavelina lepadiformis TaxID=159417 RepID=A0ABP0GSE2_CLALP